MSKYNLIDIFEQYQIGSGWTNDFDYDGMLKTGLGTSIDTPIEVLKKMSDDFEDVNYHRENSHLQDAIDAIEIGDMMEAEGRLSDFHAEIEKTMKDQGMDTSDDLGAYMASKMDLDEDKYDDIVDADDDIPADKKKAAALAYRKVDKGASYEKATSHIKEVRVDRDVAERIEGLTNRELKRKFLFAFEDLYSDLLEDEPFYAEDVINHLNNEMHKHLSSFQNTGDKFAGIEEAKPGYNADGTPKSNAEMSDDEREDFYMNLDSVDEDKSLQEKQYAPEVVDRIEMVRKALWDTNNFNAEEIEAYTRSLIGDFEKGDFEAYDDFKADDYVEDIKNYISDKSLREHFGRFMKDYQ